MQRHGLIVQTQHTHPVGHEDQTIHQSDTDVATPQPTAKCSNSEGSGIVVAQGKGACLPRLRAWDTSPCTAHMKPNKAK